MMAFCPAATVSPVTRIVEPLRSVTILVPSEFTVVTVTIAFAPGANNLLYDAHGLLITPPTRLVDPASASELLTLVRALVLKC